MRKDSLLWWFLVGVLVLGGGTVVYMATRGLRNNNPGNIRNDGTGWQGLAIPQSDPSFLTFTSPEYGIRALAHVLRSYYSEGYQTITAVITRWAPPSENDTASYIADVASDVGIDPDATLAYPDQLPAMVSAIIKHENGLNPYSDATIAAGIAMG